MCIRDSRIAVPPHVVVGEPVVEEHGEQCHHNAKYRDRMHPERGPCQGAPAQVLGLREERVGDQRQERARKRQDGQNVPKHSGPSVFADVRDLFQRIS